MGRKSVRDEDDDLLAVIPDPAVSKVRKAWDKVAESFVRWRPACDELTLVRSVPTRFVQLDRATRVNGFPIERITTVHGPSNHGKAQPVDEPVLTLDGWVPIGSLRVGDEVVGSDGRQTKVLGVYPQGHRPVLEIVFDDGGSTRACAEHLWMTTTVRELNRGRYTRGARPARARIANGRTGTGSVKRTAEIARTLTDGHYVPFMEPMYQPARGDLPVNPYVLGLLLGDGCLVQTSVTFSGNDAELHEALRAEAERLGDRCVDVTSENRCATSLVSRGPMGTKGGAELRRRLAELGLVGCGSHEKFIPEQFQWAPHVDRLALLQGLMDTDGCAQGTNSQFCTVSDRLRDGVVSLVRSLGGRARVYPKNLGDGGTAWCVLIAFGDETCPFKLKRKVASWKPRKKELRRRIVAVRPAGRAECVCIRVSAPDQLYVTKDFVVTHNTELCLGLLDSFLARDHGAALVDAEFTTPFDWPQRLMGERASHPAFVAQRPGSYEETANAVREYVKVIAGARDAGTLPEDTSALIVVDSVRKLIPANLMEEVLKVSKSDKGTDMLTGRAGQVKAQVTQAWLDELVPLMGRNRMGIVMIARETDKEGASADDRKFDTAWAVAGTKGLIFDASLVMRVTRAAWVYEGSEDDKKVIGERHRVRIWKTKVEGKEGKYTDCYFHTSNGTYQRYGFDRARDVLELAVHYGVVEKNGNWLSHEGDRIGQGTNKCCKLLNEVNPEWLAKIEAQVRERFRPDEELEGGTGDE